MIGEGPKETKRRARIKHHLSENKKVYVAAAGGTVVGAAGLFVATGGHITVVDSAKLINLQWKLPNTTPVYDKLTGESYRSMRRAAEVTQVAYDSVRRDVHGLHTRFEELPNPVFA